MLPGQLRWINDSRKAWRHLPMKHFSYAGFRHKRQFRVLTGVTPDVFQTMIERLRPHWRKRIVAAKKRSGRPWRVGELENHLLVLLLLYRCAITQDLWPASTEM